MAQIQSPFLLFHGLHDEKKNFEFRSKLRAWQCRLTFYKMAAVTSSGWNFQKMKKTPLANRRPTSNPKLRWNPSSRLGARASTDTDRHTHRHTDGQGPLRYDVNIFSHSEMIEYKKKVVVKKLLEVFILFMFSINSNDDQRPSWILYVTFFTTSSKLYHLRFPFVINNQYLILVRSKSSWFKIKIDIHKIQYGRHWPSWIW